MRRLCQAEVTHAAEAFNNQTDPTQVSPLCLGPEPDTHIILDLQPGGDHFGPEDFELSLCEVFMRL